MTSLKTSIKTITYLSDIGCLEIQVASLNISCFIRELDGFFTYLLGKQHLSDETDIISNGFLHSALSRTNKSTYGNHVRNVGRFLKYLNYRYMNLAYQDMSPTEAHQINQANHRDLAARIKVFNRVEVSRNEPAHRYKSITSQQSIELTNMFSDPTHVIWTQA